jgi:hypothetical protein
VDGRREPVRRLYYIADDLPTTRALSEALHEAGITDWNFHVVARDESGLYRHHIHSATPLQRRDIVHTGERWGMIGLAAGLLIGVSDYATGWLPWTATLFTVAVATTGGGLIGGWLGCVVGLRRENYKLESFHEEIEAGRLLIMVDVKDGSRHRVREIMNMGFPKVRFCGRDTTTINPFRRPKHVHGQPAR